MYIILTTCTSQDAPKLLQAILQERIVACGNITPSVSSMYWWAEEIQDDVEASILMETTEDCIEQALSRIEALHPYDVPKILAWRPTHVNDSYLKWLRAETRSQSANSSTEEIS